MLELQRTHNLNVCGLCGILISSSNGLLNINRENGVPFVFIGKRCSEHISLSSQFQYNPWRRLLIVNSLRISKTTMELGICLWGENTIFFTSETTEISL